MAYQGNLAMQAQNAAQVAGFAQAPGVRADAFDAAQQAADEDDQNQAGLAADEAEEDEEDDGQMYDPDRDPANAGGRNAPRDVIARRQQAILRDWRETAGREGRYFINDVPQNIGADLPPQGAANRMPIYGNMFEMRNFFARNWDVNADLLFDHMDYYGNYRNDDGNGVLNQQEFEHARNDLMNWAENHANIIPEIGPVGGRNGWVRDFIRLDAGWRGNPFRQLMMIDQQHGRPGLDPALGERPSQGRAPLRRGRNDEAPRPEGEDGEEDDDEEVDAFLENVKRGARGLASLPGTALSRLRQLAGFNDPKAEDATEGDTKEMDPDDATYPMGPPGSYPTGNGFIPSNGASGGPIGRPRAARPRVAVGPRGAVMLPPAAQQPQFQPQQQQQPQPQPQQQQQPQPAPGLRQRRAAATPAARAAQFQRMAQAGRGANSGRGKPRMHNMARLGHLYKDIMKEEVPDSAYDPKDGCFKDAKYRDWFKSHMELPEDEEGEGKMFHQRRKAIDEQHDTATGVKGKMNGCGKMAHEGDMSDSSSDSEDEKKGGHGPTHTHPDGTVMTGATHTESSKVIKEGGGKKRSARFAKGSQEAKDYMASLRAKRKKTAL